MMNRYWRRYTPAGDFHPSTAILLRKDSGLTWSDDQQVIYLDDPRPYHRPTSLQLNSPAGIITVISAHIQCTRTELNTARHQMRGLVNYLSAQGPHILAGDFDAGTYPPNDTLE